MDSTKWGGKCVGAIFLGVYLCLTGSCVVAGVPRLVKDIEPDAIAIGSYPQDFADFGRTSFFDADDGKFGHEPWSTDGTPQRTFTWGECFRRACTHIPL